MMFLSKIKNRDFTQTSHRLHTDFTYEKGEIY